MGVQSMIRNADGTISVIEQPDMIARLSEWQREQTTPLSALGASVGSAAALRDLLRSSDEVGRGVVSELNALNGSSTTFWSCGATRLAPRNAADDLAYPCCGCLLDVGVGSRIGSGEDDAPQYCVGRRALNSAKIAFKGFWVWVVAGCRDQDLNNVSQRHIGRNLFKLPLIFALNFFRHLAISVRCLRGGKGDGSIATTHPHNHSRDGGAA